VQIRKVRNRRKISVKSLTSGGRFAESKYKNKNRKKENRGAEKFPRRKRESKKKKFLVSKNRQMTKFQANPGIIHDIIK
jgi:hypothetical protein